MLRAANYNDLDSIIDIHIATLGDGLLAKLGKAFLKNIFYPSCLQSTDVLILVYEDNNKIIAFVIYTKNSALLTYQLLKKKMALGIAMIKNIFFYPSLLMDMLIVLKGFRIQLNQDYEHLLKDSAELYLIATAPACQGKGIGSILVSEGLRIFGKKLNAQTCLVKTSSSRANQFYLANKFTPIGNEYRGSQRFQILYKPINSHTDPHTTGC